MQKINLIAQSVLMLSHCENADDDDDNNDTHPGWIIVCDGKYSVTDKKTVSNFWSASLHPSWNHTIISHKQAIVHSMQCIRTPCALFRIRSRFHFPLRMRFLILDLGSTVVFKKLKSVNKPNNKGLIRRASVRNHSAESDLHSTLIG